MTQATGRPEGARPQTAAGEDPHLAVMLEARTTDAARLRGQMARTNMIAGVLLALAGAAVAASTVVSMALALVSGSAPDGQALGVGLGYFGVALAFAVGMFVAGVWLTMRGLANR